MANVLDDAKRQQIVALGRLGWSLRRIERETGVRRETASAYLRAAGVAVRRSGGGPLSGRQNRPPRRGVHRLWHGKTGHHGGGVHRLCVAEAWAHVRRRARA